MYSKCKILKICISLLDRQDEEKNISQVVKKVRDKACFLTSIFYSKSVASVVGKG